MKFFESLDVVGMADVGEDIAYSELSSLSLLTALRCLYQAQLIMLLIDVHSYW